MTKSSKSSLNKPVFNIGDYLYVSYIDKAIKVESIQIKDTDRVYYSGNGVEVAEEYCVLFSDHLHYLLDQNQESQVLRFNVGFDKPNNPVIVGYKEGKLLCEWELPLDVLIEYINDSEGKLTVVDGMKLPDSCSKCPMAGMYETVNGEEGIICCYTNQYDKNPQLYSKIRMQDCPLRSVNRELIY